MRALVVYTDRPSLFELDGADVVAIVAGLTEYRDLLEKSRLSPDTATREAAAADLKHVNELLQMFRNPSQVRPGKA